MKYIQQLISLFLLIFLSSFISVNAKTTKIASINAAIIDDRQTITVFFEKPQTFSQQEAQKQFTIDYADEYIDAEEYKHKPLTTGQWYLSNDGYRLSYYPVPMGSYRVVTGGEVVKRVYVGKADKVVNIVGRGPVLPINAGSLPVEVVGTSEVDIEFFQIDNPALLFENFYIGSNFGNSAGYYDEENSNSDLERATRNMTPAGIFRYTLPKNIDLNKKTEHRIPINKNIKSGAYIVTVKPAGQIGKKLDVRMVFISDIGLHARRYPNKTLVMANYFSSLKPVKKAQLEVWNNKGSKLNIVKEECDFQDGICIINRTLTNDEVVVVKNDEDISMLPMRELALDLNDFAVLGDSYLAQPVHVYSNRQLYRPGEEIVINALLRDKDGMRLPVQTLELALINPEGKTVQTSILKEENQGFYQTRINTGIDAKTGIWTVELRTDSRMKQPNGTLTLHIEEFMPERMELTLKPSAEKINHNQELSLNIASRYLFGAPAGGNLIKSKVNLSVLHNPYAKNKDWYVGKADYPSDILEERRTIELEDKLNDNGENTLKITLPFAEEDNKEQIHQVIRARGIVDVMDGNVFGISRTFTADFWPNNESLPIVRPLFNLSELGYGEKANFELFSADKNGVLTSRVLQLSLRYKSDYCTWVYSESRGWDCHRSNNYEIVEQKVIQSGKEPITYEVEPNSWGQYQLVLTDVNTGFVTTYDFESSWSDSTGQLPVAKPLALNISSDKPTYKEGDNVTLTFDAPYDGNLMVMVEADEALFKRAIKVSKGKNNFKFTLDKEWQRHDLYITGLLLGKNGKGEVTRALGVIPLKLDRSNRRIKARLEFPEINLPEQNVKIKLKLDDLPKNQKVYATISVTDQGILNMTPIRTKNIFNDFFGQKKYGVDIVDYYNRLFKNTSKSLLTPKFGGDGDIKGNKSDNNLTEMKTVSIASNLITINEKGEAVVEFMLPDFNGEAKVVAKIFSEQNVGETSKQMIIRSPIVADLITPKFVRVGDKAHVSLSMHNMSGKLESIFFRLSSDQFEDSFGNEIYLKDKESVNYLIPIRLLEFSPKAEVKLEIRSKMNPFKITRNYRIGTVHFAEETAEYERTLLDKNSTWTQKTDLKQYYDKNAQESLFVSRTPIINVLSYTSGLFGYPYGCTEQTTSRAFPWLFKSHPILDHEKKNVYAAYKEEKLTDKNLKKVLSYQEWETSLLSDAINKISNRQVANGGFSLWSYGDDHFPASVYATDFFYQVSKKYPNLVDSNVLNKVSRYLKNEIVSFGKYLEKQDKYQTTSSRLNDVAYATWILAREGKIFSADLAIFNQYVMEMSPLSRTYLAAAHFVLGNEKQGQKIMQNLSFVEWKRQNGYFYTNLAETALAIDLINQLRVRSLYKNSTNLVTDLSKLLDNQLKNRSYFSTQERYALIKIGIDVPDDPKPIDVNINGKKTKMVSGQAIDAKQIASLTSSEPLFIEYQIKGYPIQKRSSSGFKTDFSINYNGLDEYKIGKEHINYRLDKPHYEVKVGDRFLVEINIKSERDLPSALLVAQIPGGFNLVNPNLLGMDADYFYGTFDGYENRSSFDHEEFRFSSYIVSRSIYRSVNYKFVYVIEAAVPGTYEVPSVTIEDMYLPMLKNTYSFKDKITILKP